MERLIVPVYLNQKLVFDLLAMLQGGISTITAVTKTQSEQNSNKEKISTGFGLSEAFSTLLKIDLSGTKDKSKTKTNEKTASEERVHTPASLFYQLRNLLVENGYLKELSVDVQPKAGDFVEFEGSLKRNPIIETIDTFVQMLDLALTLEDNTSQKVQGHRSKKPNSENEKLRQQMASISDSLKAGSTIDLTANNLSTDHTAVITVETAFLNDPMMSDLVDGQFKVVGKVVNSVITKSESISLLRKTAFSKLPLPILMQSFSQLSQLGSAQGFSIPELVWEVKGPAIQVLPIAIYA